MTCRRPEDIDPSRTITETQRKGPTFESSPKK